MQVDDNFQAVIGCPRHRVVEVLDLTLNVGFVAHVEGPITDGQANMVEAGGL